MRKFGFLAVALLVGAFSLSAFSQPAQPGQPGQPGGAAGGNTGGRGNRGNFNPQQYQQQFNDRLKTELGMTDDEFKAVQPKIEAVTTASRATRGNRGFGGGGGRTRGGNNGTPAAADPNAPAPTALQTATDELTKTLANKDATPDEIKNKLAAVRDAKTKAKEALTKAQADLKELLTARQEAVLVNNGMLE